MAQREDRQALHDKQTKQSDVQHYTVLALTSEAAGRNIDQSISAAAHTHWCQSRLPTLESTKYSQLWLRTTQLTASISTTDVHVNSNNVNHYKALKH